MLAALDERVDRSSTVLLTDRQHSRLPLDDDPSLPETHFGVRDPNRLDPPEAVFSLVAGLQGVVGFDSPELADVSRNNPLRFTDPKGQYVVVADEYQLERVKSYFGEENLRITPTEGENPARLRGWQIQMTNPRGAREHFGSRWASGSIPPGPWAEYFEKFDSYSNSTDAIWQLEDVTFTLKWSVDWKSRAAPTEYVRNVGGHTIRFRSDKGRFRGEYLVPLSAAPSEFEKPDAITISLSGSFFTPVLSGGGGGFEAVYIFDKGWVIYGQAGPGVGVPGGGGSLEVGPIWKLDESDDYTEDFIQVSGGVPGAGGSVFFWGEGPRGFKVGPYIGTPGASVQYQYYWKLVDFTEP